MEQVVALNSRFHDVYLSMPMEATLLPELQGLSYWGRRVHEVLQEVNPHLMCRLADARHFRPISSGGRAISRARLPGLSESGDGYTR